jgi:hypothetical protein
MTLPLFGMCKQSNPKQTGPKKLMCAQILSRSMLVTEKNVAVAAIRRACGLTSLVFNKLVRGETLTKNDRTPVTGRYAASCLPSLF